MIGTSCMKELTSNLLLLSRDCKFIYTWVIFNARTECDYNDLRLMYTHADLKNVAVHSSSYKKHITHIAHYNTFHLLRYLHFRFVKCLLRNIQKQQNTLKSSLLFKKNKLYGWIAWEFWRFRMRNLQNIIFTWIKTYGEIFKYAFGYL